MATISGSRCWARRAWRARATRTQPTVERFGAEGSATDPILTFFLDRYVASYAAELDHFIEVAARRAAPAITAHDGVAALALAEAAIESTRTGQTVDVAAWGL